VESQVHFGPEHAIDPVSLYISDAWMGVVPNLLVAVVNLLGYAAFAPGGHLYFQDYSTILTQRNFLKMKIRLLLMACLYFSLGVRAQTDSLLHNPLPTTKEEFTASEPKVLNTINYLETTPIDKQHDAWRDQAAMLMAWLTNSPEVTVDIDSKTVTFGNKNPELLMIFMGGWTKYVLQNGYSQDKVQANVAGIKSAIKVYKLGNGLKKDKEMDKLIKLDDGGGLEAWVVAQLGQKG
jgi:hypothetical protein